MPKDLPRPGFRRKLPLYSIIIFARVSIIFLINFTQAQEESPQPSPGLSNKIQVDLSTISEEQVQGKSLNPQLKLLYKKWNPRKQNLLEGLTKQEARGIYHYSATLDEQGRVKDVVYFSRKGRRLWTYHMIWDTQEDALEYDLEFHIRKPITILDPYLFTLELSELRPSWRIRYQLNDTFNLRVVEVFDAHGDLVYFYNFTYRRNEVTSIYSRADSTLVGSHKIEYKSKGKVSRITYFNSNGIMKRKVTYEYPADSENVIITQFNSRGDMVERRTIKQD